MPLKNTQKIKCPDCGTEGEFTIWQSINTKLNPQAKEDLLSGKLFAYTCPECRKVHYINYGLLYHQMEKQLMIYYAISKEDEKEILDSFAKMENGDMLPGMESTDYTCRVVHSQNQLREKAYIFDIGLDDRVVEIIEGYDGGAFVADESGFGGWRYILRDHQGKAGTICDPVEEWCIGQQPIYPESV